MTLAARLRRLWLDVHLWIGAGLLIVLVPLSVTGSILVWHDAIDRALYSQRYATSGALASRAVADYAAAAARAFGGRARIAQLRLPQRPGDPVVAVGRMAGPPEPGGRPRTLNAWIDPPTGRVLDVAEVARQPTLVIHRLHGSLLVPGVGRKIVGWLGWAMFVSSATGLWLWWPRRGGVAKGLRWRRGASTLFNLHHLVGFWTCLPLAALSLTGVYIAFPQASHALVGAPPPPQRPAVRAAPDLLARPRMTVSEAVAAAEGGSPATVAQVDWPAQGRAPAWKIGFVDRPGPVQVVDATGEAKAGHEDAARRPAPDPVSKLMRQVHDGTDMGVAAGDHPDRAHADVARRERRRDVAAPAGAAAGGGGRLGRGVTSPACHPGLGGAQDRDPTRRQASAPHAARGIEAAPFFEEIDAWRGVGSRSSPAAKPG